jgi:hypothetical protein
MANPNPEIMPDAAKAAGVRVIGTGRSDFPNQVNNVLAFPGIFKGALSVRARDINDAIDALNQKEEKVIGCVFGNVYPGFGERIGGSYGYGYGYGAYSRAER